MEGRRAVRMGFRTNATWFQTRDRTPVYPRCVDGSDKTMATSRLMNPGPGQVEEAIERAIGDANSGSRSRTVYAPAGLSRLILGSSEGVHQSDGGGGPPNAYRESQTSSLFAAWWTSKGGDKFVLVDGRRVDAMPSTPDSPRGVPDFKLKPSEAIRGWRKPRSGGIEGSFQGRFSDLGRMPALDPTREALSMAALYGDSTARGALHDYDEERGSGTAR
jgi:hypothetical protein